MISNDPVTIATFIWKYSMMSSYMVKKKHLVLEKKHIVGENA